MAGTPEINREPSGGARGLIERQDRMSGARFFLRGLLFPRVASGEISSPEEIEPAFELWCTTLPEDFPRPELAHVWITARRRRSDARRAAQEEGRSSTSQLELVERVFDLVSAAEATRAARY